jgi:predicted GIY-YIG superfamily endonuclease
MAFWCYILKCSDGRYYTGHTDDLERRMAQHHTGGYCDFTARRQPVVLMWAQDFPSRIEALEAERRISPWSRKKKEALIASDWKALSYWAKPPCARPSTSLGTNGEGDAGTPCPPFVPSEVEGPITSDTP